MLKPRPVLNDEWIEAVLPELEAYGSSEFYMDPEFYLGFMDTDEIRQFMELWESESHKYAHEFEAWHEFEKVLTHAEPILKYHLEEQSIYNKVPSEDEIDLANQAWFDTAHNLADLYAEAWHQLFVKKDLMPLSRNLEGASS